MSKKRRGIVSVSMSLLDSWMHLPAGTRVVDVRRREGAPLGEFEVMIEGDAVPETPERETTPHMQCTVTIAEPQVAFHVIEPRQSAQVAGTNSDGTAA